MHIEDIIINESFNGDRQKYLRASYSEFALEMQPEENWLDNYLPCSSVWLVKECCVATIDYIFNIDKNRVLIIKPDNIHIWPLYHELFTSSQLNKTYQVSSWYTTPSGRGYDGSRILLPIKSVYAFGKKVSVNNFTPEGKFLLQEIRKLYLKLEDIETVHGF